MRYPPTGLCAEIRKLLREAPATTEELSALLSVPTGSRLNASLCSMHKYGQITRRYVPIPEPKHGPKNISLWSIVP